MFEGLGKAVLPEEPDRLAYDQELCTRFRTSGCHGKEWDAFAAAIYQKAVRTTFRWISDGFIFLQCSARNRPVDAGDIAEWSRHDIKELAHEVVAESFSLFVRVGIEGCHWQPDKGASLFTYFMNGVVLSFPNVYRKKRTERTRWHHRVDLHGRAEDIDQVDIRNYNVSLELCAKMLRSLLDGINSPQQRKIAELYFIDCLSVTQIAERLQISYPRANGLLDRARSHMRRKYHSKEGGRR